MRLYANFFIQSSVVLLSFFWFGFCSLSKFFLFFVFCFFFRFVTLHVTGRVYPLLSLEEDIGRVLRADVVVALGLDSTPLSGTIGVGALWLSNIQALDLADVNVLLAFSLLDQLHGIDQVIGTLVSEGLSETVDVFFHLMVASLKVLNTDLGVGSFLVGKDSTLLDYLECLLEFSADLSDVAEMGRLVLVGYLGLQLLLKVKISNSLSTILFIFNEFIPGQ
ncbi:hypothetical protein HG531_002522 [Fusarium graminearum]|nr:hypothetical protein HG531_002522 [Fusarium graminearum]